MITIYVQESPGNVKPIEIPEDINLNLMEVLKAADYPVAGTCGGMALCASCHIEVIKGIDQLDAAGDAELDMLDTLPAASSKSRLACQLKINDLLQNITIRIKEPSA
jgi:2Fe-2S ferredoxin